MSVSVTNDDPTSRWNVVQLTALYHVQGSLSRTVSNIRRQKVPYVALYTNYLNGENRLALKIALEKAMTGVVSVFVQNGAT